MVDKKIIKRRLKKIYRIKTWQLFVLLAIMLVVSATLLRLNNIGMVEKRNAVMAADKLKDQAAIKSGLIDLQKYVSSHMNSDMGKGIYLETSYQTAISDAYTAALGAKSTNVYAEVQHVCMPRYTTWSMAYVRCVSDELAKYPEGQSLASEVKQPVPDNYLHVYVSPLWSPDAAGWSVLVSVVILIMIMVKITSVIILKSLLKIKYRNI